MSIEQEQADFVRLTKDILAARSDPPGDPDAAWANATEIARGGAGNTARGLMALGYAKPRTITTIEKLATLPLESVVIDAARCVGELESVSSTRTWWSLTGYEGEISGSNLNFPVTVLYTPEPTL